MIQLRVCGFGRSPQTATGGIGMKKVATLE
jgi:hypothetical protein